MNYFLFDYFLEFMHIFYVLHIFFIEERKRKSVGDIFPPESDNRKDENDNKRYKHLLNDSISKNIETQYT